MSFDVDIIIIGAGVIGLAVAFVLSRENRNIFILEKNETFGRETSSRNSGTIHTSVLSPSGSLNAKLCSTGNPLLYDLCYKYGIGCRKTGKILVAGNDSEAEILETLFQRKAEGIKMKRLSKSELRKLEPEVKGKSALLLPEAGIVDAYALMRCFLGLAKYNGAQLICKTEVIGIDKERDIYRIHFQDCDGISNINARIVINCAGLNSDKVASMAGIDTSENGLHNCFFKGEYYTICPDKAKRMNQRLVYPMLRQGGLVGIHTVLGVDGRVRLGPDFYPVDKIDYSIDDSRKQNFYEGVQRLFPFVQFEDIEPESTGIMPRLYAKNAKFTEFRIYNEQEKGLMGFINLEGIESPGLTASPAIAQYVSKLVDELLTY